MPGMSMALLATLAAALGALAGVSLTSFPRSARLAAGVSGALLLGVALLGLLPEVVSQTGWATAAVLFTAGYALLMTIDRFIYPVCPSCSHDHDHDSCHAVLHGFAGPLILATAFHAFLDGWSIAASQWAGGGGLRVALPVTLALHKIPEGIALGAILRAAVETRMRAFRLCLLTESATVLGAGAGLMMAPRMGALWLHYPLAIAGGCFFYLGFHAIHAEWRRFVKSHSRFFPSGTKS